MSLENETDKSHWPEYARLVFHQLESLTHNDEDLKLRLDKFLKDYYQEYYGLKSDLQKQINELEKNLQLQISKMSGKVSNIQSRVIWITGVGAFVISLVANYLIRVLTK